MPYKDPERRKQHDRERAKLPHRRESARGYARKRNRDPQFRAYLSAWKRRRRREQPERTRAEDRAYREAHPERVRVASLRYRHANIEAVRTQQREAMRVKRKTSEWQEAQRVRMRRYKERQRAGQVKLAGRPPSPVCELCLDPTQGPTVFDHDHATDLFRGWLCHRCNRTLGQVKDDVGLLEVMIAYLRNGGTIHGDPDVSRPCANGEEEAERLRAAG